jgi:hypothetical protein
LTGWLTATVTSPALAQPVGAVNVTDWPTGMDPPPIEHTGVMGFVVVSHSRRSTDAVVGALELCVSGGFRKYFKSHVGEHLVVLSEKVAAG